MDTPFYIRKLANLFSPSSKLSSGAASLPLVGAAASGAVENYRRRHGGVWIGGVVELTSDGIFFKANALNRALNSGKPTKRLAMKDVRAVRWEFGILTGIVVVLHKNGELRFRCFGARGVVKRFSEHLAAL